MGGITVVPSTLFMLLLIYGFAVLGASVELEDLMVAPEVPKSECSPHNFSRMQ